MMSKLLVNGVAVVTPKTFKVAINDIDGETGRNANGDMIRDRISVKRKLECSWGMLTQNEIQTLLNAVQSEFFSVTYPDPQLGQTTKTFYVGDRTTPAYSWVENMKPWSDLSMNFVER